MKLLDDVVIIREDDVEGGHNAFAIMASFKAEARNQGIKRADVDAVLELAMKQKSYEDLLNVFRANTFYAV